MRRPDASMTLLREAMERPLDPGYALAAQRRRAAREGHDGGDDGGASTRRLLTRAATALVAVGIGIGLAAASGGLRTAPNPNNALRERIIQVDGTVAKQEQQANALAAQVGDLRRQAGSAQPSAGSTEAPGLTVSAGTTAVHGPGISITLTDNTAAGEQGRVADADLQAVVNGLWEAGAEAVGVNNQRIGPGTAIRSAGRAILVNFRPLNGPYLVSAVGDPKTLRSWFETGSGGRYLALLLNDYGINAPISDQTDVWLPAVPQPVLRYATPQGGTSS